MRLGFEARPLGILWTVRWAPACSALTPKWENRRWNPPRTPNLLKRFLKWVSANRQPWVSSNLQQWTFLDFEILALFESGCYGLGGEAERLQSQRLPTAPSFQAAQLRVCVLVDPRSTLLCVDSERSYTVFVLSTGPPSTSLPFAKPNGVPEALFTRLMLQKVALSAPSRPRIPRDDTPKWLSVGTVHVLFFLPTQNFRCSRHICRVPRNSLALTRSCWASGGHNRRTPRTSNYASWRNPMEGLIWLAWVPAQKPSAPSYLGFWCRGDDLAPARMQ